MYVTEKLIAITNTTLESRYKVEPECSGSDEKYFQAFVVLGFRGRAILYKIKSWRER
jgi:hypothetical protein